ncbi:CPBP family intramembrane glutamic endopeptidase [Falsirhodobacter algicola]|uniref:CPBP family intramembrane metalloprotease n=1 Tax=Falsirhodobacter algicola TaxID=2692330 RepID=A0A8J8MR38_9RHOB|nr:CPBP family intramembrane glutamic endopeptidase [Falsirhodobacter algicola]QUS35192.1 CPBP family intramembrane metalloprotease [Falsirhodobacter algicola]
MTEIRQIDAPRLLLYVEFVAFFVIVPVAVAFYLPPDRLFEGLFAFMLVGLALLWATPGFRWHELTRGWRAIRWRAVAGLALATLLAGMAVMQIAAPQRMFATLLDHPQRLLAIVILYPLLSALPQEVVFRALWFRRYRDILPGGAAGMVLNAAFFSLAHLMYWSAVVTVMTFAGGLAFAWAHSVRRSFPMAWVMHSVAGLIIFTVGLGIYFYSGNAVRPF